MCQTWRKLPRRSKLCQTLVRCDQPTVVIWERIRGDNKHICLSKSFAWLQAIIGLTGYTFISYAWRELDLHRTELSRVSMTGSLKADINNV